MANVLGDALKSSIFKELFNAPGLRKLEFDDAGAEFLDRLNCSTADFLALYVEDLPCSNSNLLKSIRLVFGLIRSAQVSNISVFVAHEWRVRADCGVDRPELIGELPLDRIPLSLSRSLLRISLAKPWVGVPSYTSWLNFDGVEVWKFDFDDGSIGDVFTKLFESILSFGEFDTFKGPDAATGEK